MCSVQYPLKFVLTRVYKSMPKYGPSMAIYAYLIIYNIVSGQFAYLTDIKHTINF